MERAPPPPVAMQPWSQDHPVSGDIYLLDHFSLLISDQQQENENPRCLQHYVD